ncbi:hypothetical protein [Wolbachia endosymbiont of Madathamugadia hiepei]|uniref:hypothetical protein n=1 Tax=Wolbachia endosymbiont of Madathamugadia hiepei TaxID=1241303 RepID=UPI00158EB75D|nr:hypothetical protein [Wolbachia endosymbiont of Madathamugadia hiepei]
MLGTTDKDTYLTKLKDGGRFAIYAFGIHLAATFTIGCSGLIVGSPLLTFSLAMLISNPIVWILMGVALAATYKFAIEPLFCWVKGYVSGKGADQDKDSGVGKEFSEDLQTLVHQTNRENYTYWLQQHDIAHIARVRYGYSESSEGDTLFCIPGDVNSLNSKLKEYKNEVAQRNPRKIFTSIANLGGNHWVTLIVTYNQADRQFKAYYCDSFGKKLPNKVEGQIKDYINLANEITEECVKPLDDKVDRLIRERGIDPDNLSLKEKKDDLEKTLNDARKYRNKLVSRQIDTNYIVGVLQETLEIEDDGNMRSSEAKQQDDGCNCGVFALENAHKITQMLNEGKSFDEIDKELSEYKFDLNKKRKGFAEALMNDGKWKEDLENGFSIPSQEHKHLLLQKCRMLGLVTLYSCCLAPCPFK